MTDATSPSHHAASLVHPVRRRPDPAPDDDGPLPPDDMTMHEAVVWVAALIFAASAILAALIVPWSVGIACMLG